MKKNFKNALLALALIAAGTGAYATKAANAPKANLDEYNWQLYDRETQEPTGDTFDAEESVVRSTYGCNDTTPLICAEGTSPNGNLTIYYSL